MVENVEGICFLETLPEIPDPPNKNKMPNTPARGGPPILALPAAILSVKDGAVL